MSFGVDGATGRALLVAALAVSLFALIRYWRAYSAYSPRARFILLGLRALSLLLLSLALAGLRIEYETKMPMRVLVRYLNAQSEESSLLNLQNAAVRNVLNEFKERELVVVDYDDLRDERADSQSFGAAILITDGALDEETARREVEKTSASSGGVPVYVLMTNTETTKASVTLESVVMMNEAIRGVPVTVRCMLHARGMSGRASLVTVEDNAKVQASASVRWTKDDERQVVTLEIVPKVGGWNDYVTKVEAASADAENDKESARLRSRSFSLYALERRLRVLFFEGEPTWEAKFIRRALDQSNLFDVDYFAQVSRESIVGQASTESSTQDQGAENSVEEKTEPADETKNTKANNSSPEAKLHEALSSAVRLNAYDTIIVGATPNTLLTAAESARIRAWVETRGGGLIVLGGNSFTGSIVAPNGKLYGLLPTAIDPAGFASESQEVARGGPVETERTRGGVALTPTEAGAMGALRGYLRSIEGAALKTDALTGQGLKLGALRAGASALAVTGKANAEGISHAGSPLVAGMRNGAGRVLLFAPADSWRIRTSAGGEQDNTGGPFEALWQGLTLWSLAGARSPIELSLSEQSPAMNDNVIAEIRVRDASFTPQKIEKLSARLQPLTEGGEDEATEAGLSREIAFAPDYTDASVWRAKFPAPARGKFSLEVDYVAAGKSGSTEKRFSVVEALAFETGAAHDTLDRTSRQTGGELIAAKDARTLAQRLSLAQPSTEKIKHTWEMRLWWPLAVIIPILLSAEWFMRRWWQVD